MDFLNYHRPRAEVLHEKRYSADYSDTFLFDSTKKSSFDVSLTNYVHFLLQKVQKLLCGADCGVCFRLLENMVNIHAFMRRLV